MENAMYVALSRQMILRREMDIVANNIANADTPGFKVESVIAETDPQPIPGDPTAATLQFVLDTGLARDFGQGALVETGSPLDVGIEGDGFFQVLTDGGERFTRNGRFSLDGEGRLVASDGSPVITDGGEVIVDPDQGEIAVAADGTISQDGAVVGQLTVYRFASLSALEKTGDGRYANIGNQAPEAAAAVFVRQGMYETSNVQPIMEVTKMIEVSREYERMARLIDQNAQLEKTAIERLGRVA